MREARRVNIAHAQIKLEFVCRGETCVRKARGDGGFAAAISVTRSYLDCSHGSSYSRSPSGEKIKKVNNNQGHVLCL